MLHQRQANNQYESIIYARRLFSLMPPSDVTEIKSKIIKEGS
jgi:hypothetical protein